MPKSTESVRIEVKTKDQAALLNYALGLVHRDLSARLEEVSVQIFGAQQNGAVLRLGLTAKANINGYWTDVFFGANLEQNGTWAKLTDSELG